MNIIIIINLYFACHLHDITNIKIQKFIKFLNIITLLFLMTLYINHIMLCILSIIKYDQKS
jgi:hypothetical protein